MSATVLLSSLRRQGYSTSALHSYSKSHLDQYRIIRSPLGVSGLWDHLADNPTLAREVRVLEIQRQMGGYGIARPEPKVPEQFHSAAQHVAGTGIPYSFFLSKYVPGLREAEKVLIAALRSMSGLQSFIWNREPPLLDSRFDVDVSDDIWTALRSCTCLRELNVVDAADDDIKIYEEPRGWFDPCAGTRFRRVHESLIFSLSNLTSLKYTTYAYNGDLLNVPMRSLSDMLIRRSPNLKTLNLNFVLYSNCYLPNNERLTTVNLNSLFHEARWPHLETLVICGGHLSPAVAARFFSPHPSISSITLANHIPQDQPIIISDPCDPGFPEPIQFPANTLPNLAFLSAPSYFSVPLVMTPANGVRPLRALSLSMHKLTEGVMHAVRKIPVQHLLLNDTMATHSASEDKIHWLDSLSHFPQLEKLQTYINFAVSSERIVEQIRPIATRCPQLRKIVSYDSVCELTKLEDGVVRWKVTQYDKEGMFSID